MTAALQTIGLTKRFGGITAAEDIGFSLERGARHALIGPNGAGKTTFVNLLTGVLKPTTGQVLLDGADITNLTREARVRRGMARTFQINQLFAAMTPLEMIALVVSERLGRGLRVFARLDRDHELTAETADILARFKLTDIMDERISSPPPSPRSPRCCCWTSLPRVCRKRSGANCSTPSRACRRMSPCC
jgi:branched-chain amino acid transport system ATP-binding protein